MCGRIVQKSGPLDYVERIFPNPRRVFDDPAGPLYNIPPGTRPLTMHRLAGDFELERLHWGWRPHNSKYFMPSAAGQDPRRRLALEDAHRARPHPGARGWLV
ncbi:SOS response-associated peptidase family protein [Achromobacter xylosoxidans]|uniref:hypothetical protein n=1 Tax=Alcaligenes xylosoxydans xylosoxydans TaxID=85698 RepID=UPI000B102DBA|nr:hypothetical protein [Achromobacter xylosoxidans]